MMIYPNFIEMLRVSLILFFVPFCFALFEGHLEVINQRSPSLHRCISAILYGFTDKPPFDGKSVELHFSHDYNETELQETVRILGPERVLEARFTCQKAREVREENDRKEAQRLLRWKQNVLAQNMEQKCNDHIEEMQKKNANKYFWQKDIDDPVLRVCPCIRDTISSPDLDWEWAIHHHPCQELECFRKGRLTDECWPKGEWGGIYCDNFIKLKI